MAEENKKQKMKDLENKEIIKKVKETKINEEKKLGQAEKKVSEKKEKMKTEKIEKEIKEETKKTETKKAVSTEAVVNGRDLGISTKHAVAVCNFIRNKNIEIVLRNLEDVIKFKKAVPMKGEIPHRKGIMSGRYPINAVREFIKLLKSLRANAIFNELELEKFKIFCMANKASSPFKRFGQRRLKRSHVQIKLMPISVGEK